MKVENDCIGFLELLLIYSSRALIKGGDISLSLSNSCVRNDVSFHCQYSPFVLLLLVLVLYGEEARIMSTRRKAFQLSDLDQSINATTENC